MAPSLLGIIVTLSLAAEPTGNVPAAKAAPGAAPGVIVVPKPVGYRADSCKLLSGAPGRTLECTGHVKIWRDDLSLTCQKVAATFSGNNLATATCIGAVQIVTTKATARAERAEFDGGKNQVQLTGKPRAQQNGATLKAERIRLDLVTGEIETEGHVEGVLGPELFQGRTP